MSPSASQGSSRPLRVRFETMGCRSNFADTIDLQAALIERGDLPVDAGDVDVIVVNTCSVTDTADRDALKLIEKLRTSSPTARVVVTGCFAESGTEALQRQGLADAVVGPGRRADVLNAIRSDVSELQRESSIVPLPQKKGSGRRQSISIDAPISAALSGPLQPLGETRARARYHLRIQEGCDNFCTFCIIPFTRGSLSSRPASLLLEDIRRLNDLGYDEIVLTGTHIGGYGEDCGSSLLALLEQIAAANIGPRIRLSSIDPNDLSNEIVDLVAEQHIFCRHLHICIQALSDRILKRMNRRYRMSDVRTLLAYAEQKIEKCCIGSDLITGFPGESREELEQEIGEFLALPLSYLHVFPFSERSGTGATVLDGAIPVAERKRRAARWRALSERRFRDYLHGFVGETVEVVIERCDERVIVGTSNEFLPVRFVGASHAAFTRGKRIFGKVVRIDVAQQTENGSGSIGEDVAVCELLSRES